MNRGDAELALLIAFLFFGLALGLWIEREQRVENER